MKVRNTPKFLAPSTCPHCGSDDTYTCDSREPGGNIYREYMACQECLAEWERVGTVEYSFHTIEYNGQEWALPCDPDPVKEALLAACKDVLGQYEWGRLQYEDRDHDRVAASIRQLRAAIDLAEKGE